MVAGLCTSQMGVSLRQTGREGRQLALGQVDDTPSKMGFSMRRMSGDTVTEWIGDSGQRCARALNQQVCVRRLII